MQIRCRLVLLFIVALLPTACATKFKFIFMSDKMVYQSLLGYIPYYPETKFIVLADVHLYDSRLGTTGAAFEAYMAEDRKLLAESESIFKSVVEKIENTDAEFVLIAGDLTKDGEEAGYQLLIPYLNRIKENGKKIYVVPGNHDINNSDADRFVGNKAEHIKSVSPEEFKNFFADFGYRDALYHDSHSLSYVAEPKDGLWLLALDACRYRENKLHDHPIIDGKFRPETVAWMEAILIQALHEKKAVIAMLHHGIMEHFKDQEKYFGDYIVDNHEAIARLLAMYNVRLTFTGHYHANDVTIKKYEKNKFIYDIETGSLVTYPCPFRYVSIASDSVMSIKTDYVDRTDTHPEDFRDYTKNFTTSGIDAIAKQTMKKFGVGEHEANFLAPQVCSAIMAHYSGNERYSGSGPALGRAGLQPITRILIANSKEMIEEFWVDLAPYEDNNLSIDLKTGTWVKN